ncbi:MAG: hypothetical protein K8U03_26020 [Planctomycetia bacterium]|nr:hypothetical protein [Planctomycetia bacterium]
MSPLVSDEEALEAFKNAFGVHSVVEKKDARIRIGKIDIALKQLAKTIRFAQDCGVDRRALMVLAQEYKRLSDLVGQFEQQALPDMKQLEALKKTCRSLESRAQDALAKRRLPTLPDDAGIFIFDVPGLDNLEKRQRDEKIQEVRQKVCRGAGLASGALSGLPPYDSSAPTKESVVDLCWYLKGMAQTKLGEPYQEGAMTLDDPNGNLAKFFDNCPDSYPRKSSHLRPQQQQAGSQGRGLDIPGGFPGDMNTVLWHPYVTDKGERRIYVKFESAGSHSFVDKGKREVARRQENDNDSDQAWQHTLSFFGMAEKPNVRKVEVAQTREGTVNGAVLAAYSDLRDACPTYSTILDRNKQKSKQNSEGKITGGSRALAFTPFAPDYWDVQSQNKNVEDMLADVIANNKQLWPQIKPFVFAWRQAMQDAEYYDNASQRLGDEIVLVTTDLKPVTSPVPNEGDINRDRALIPMMDLLRLQRDQQPRLMTGDKDALLFVYYEKLTFPSPVRRNRFVDVPHVLLVDTQSTQFSGCLSGGARMEMGTIKKWTGGLPRKKHFEYVGNVTQQEMFAALQNTGWDMGNLKKATDLIKKG